MQTSIHSPLLGNSAPYKFAFQRMHEMQRRSTSSLHEKMIAPAQGAPQDLSEPHQKPTLRTDVSHRFGVRLRELRRERNLTQVRMAAEFGIDRSFISDVERGKKSLSLPMLEVIALGMKISLSELLKDI